MYSVAQRNTPVPRMRRSAVVLLVVGLVISAALNVGWLVLRLSGPGYRTALESTAASLQPSMSKGDVVALFGAKYKFTETEFQNGFYQSGPPNPTVIFQTNVLQGEMVTFQPREIGVWDEFEMCTVYFDTNGVIVAYDYSRS